MKERKHVFRAIVAHPIPAEQVRIASILEKDGLFRVVCTTHDGMECLRQALVERPALLVLDAVLDRIDGLEVLRRLRESSEEVKPSCLMLTSYGNYIREYAKCLGADYCLITPCSDKALLDSARMLVISPGTFFSDREIDTVTTLALQELNVPSQLVGYVYVKDGVRILIRDPDLVRRRCVVKELYGVIAANYGLADAKPIEHAMRTLIKHVFEEDNIPCLPKYFSDLAVRRLHMTNTEFLVALTSFVRAKLESGQTNRNATHG